MSGLEDGEFRSAMAEFRGAVLTRLDRMDWDRNEARSETRGALEKIQADVLDLKLKYTYARGKVAGIAAAASLAVALLWQAIKYALGGSPRT